MMRATKPVHTSAFITGRFTGGTPAFVVEPKKYLRHMPRNPWFNTVHDKVSHNYTEGFTALDMDPVLRYKHNTLPIGMAVGKYQKNPIAKTRHWLEVNNFDKVLTQMKSEEAFCHMIVGIGVVFVTVYHLTRYAFYHPDLTWWKMVMWPMKPLTNELRCADRHPIDAPVFRYAQNPSEFYGYDHRRELVEMGIVANDPWVLHLKKEGKINDYYLRPTEKVVHFWPPSKEVAKRFNKTDKEIAAIDAADAVNHHH